MKETKTKRMLPTNQIRAQIDSTVDEENRTVELVWTTGSKGLRMWGSGRYYEELAVDEQSVDMSRLREGAPLLAAHNDMGLDGVIGVVERAWLQDGKGMAKVRFARDADSDAIFQKVKDKILRNVSVGYSVQEYTRISGEDEEVPTYRATRWQPAEISIVPIGFDNGAKTRNSEILTENEVEIIDRSLTQEVEMPPEIKPTVETVDTEALKQEAIKAERKRSTEIRTMVKDAGLEDSLAEDFIERGLPSEEAKKNVDAMKRAIEKSNAVQIQSTVRVEVGATDMEKKSRGLEEAILHRIDRVNFQATDASRQFLGKSMLRQIEDYIGRNVGESDASLAHRAMSSSDFPKILANIAEKSIQKRYTLTPRTSSLWTKTDTLRNFKEHKQVAAGDFSSLSERTESGEFKYGSFGEKQESAQLKQYGKIHKFTEVALINDDTKLLTLVGQEHGVGVARLENRLCYSALRTNKTMGDGGLLYNTTAITTAGGHANLGTAGVPSETTFKAAFMAMRSQKSVDGLDTLNIAPKFVVCGPELEYAFKKFLMTVSPTAIADAHIFANSVQLVVDSEIDDDDYYFIADPNQIDTVTLFRLEGQESPQVETRYNWSDNSVELKVSHNCNAEPMEWRSLYKNVNA